MTSTKIEKEMFQTFFDQLADKIKLVETIPINPDSSILFIELLNLKNLAINSAKEASQSKEKNEKLSKLLRSLLLFTYRYDRFAKNSSEKGTLQSWRREIEAIIKSCEEFMNAETFIMPQKKKEVKNLPITPYFSELLSSVSEILIYAKSENATEEKINQKLMKIYDLSEKSKNEAKKNPLNFEKINKLLENLLSISDSFFKTFSYLERFKIWKALMLNIVNICKKEIIIPEVKKSSSLSFKINSTALSTEFIDKLDKLINSTNLPEHENLVNKFKLFAIYIDQLVDESENISDCINNLENLLNDFINKCFLNKNDVGLVDIKFLLRICEKYFIEFSKKKFQKSLELFCNFITRKHAEVTSFITHESENLQYNKLSEKSSNILLSMECLKFSKALALIDVSVTPPQYNILCNHLKSFTTYLNTFQDTADTLSILANLIHVQINICVSEAMDLDSFDYKVNLGALLDIFPKLLKTFLDFEKNEYRKTQFDLLINFTNSKIILLRESLFEFINENNKRDSKKESTEKNSSNLIIFVKPQSIELNSTPKKKKKKKKNKKLIVNIPTISISENIEDAKKSKEDDSIRLVSNPQTVKHTQKSKHKLLKKNKRVASKSNWQKEIEEREKEEREQKNKELAETFMNSDSEEETSETDLRSHSPVSVSATTFVNPEKVKIQDVKSTKSELSILKRQLTQFFTPSRTQQASKKPPVTPKISTLAQTVLAVTSPAISSRSLNPNQESITKIDTISPLLLSDENDTIQTSSTESSFFDNSFDVSKSSKDEENIPISEISSESSFLPTVKEEKLSWLAQVSQDLEKGKKIIHISKPPTDKEIQDLLIFLRYSKNRNDFSVDEISINCCHLKKQTIPYLANVINLLNVKNYNVRNLSLDKTKVLQNKLIELQKSPHEKSKRDSSTTAFLPSDTIVRQSRSNRSTNTRNNQNSHNLVQTIPSFSEQNLYPALPSSERHVSATQYDGCLHYPGFWVVTQTYHPIPVYFKPVELGGEVVNPTLTENSFSNR